jgi:hypothetical protein
MSRLRLPAAAARQLGRQRQSSSGRPLLLVSGQQGPGAAAQAAAGAAVQRAAAQGAAAEGMAQVVLLPRLCRSRRYALGPRAAVSAVASEETSIAVLSAHMGSEELSCQPATPWTGWSPGDRCALKPDVLLAADSIVLLLQHSFCPWQLDGVLVDGACLLGSAKLTQAHASSRKLTQAHASAQLRAYVVLRAATRRC